MTEMERIIAIPDLGKKIDEALFDAVNHFGKKCPYCHKNLYDGNIRNKIEIDHYVPITLGGQHVPWNVLPVCKKCNRSKKNIHPKNFLDIDVQKACEAFLESIKNNLVDCIQLDIDAVQQAKVYIENELQRVSSCETKNVLIELSKIFKMDIDFASSDLSLPFGEHTIREFILRECDLGNGYSVSKDYIYNEYTNFCSANNMRTQTKEQFFKELYSLTQGVSFFRPRVNGKRESRLIGITTKR